MIGINPPTVAIGRLYLGFLSLGTTSTHTSGSSVNNIKGRAIWQTGMSGLAHASFSSSIKSVNGS